MQRLLLVALAAMFVQQDVTRTIELWSSDPIAIDIAWITINAEGKETVTAARKTVAGPPSPLAFVHGPNRFVRFSYEGASPRTYSTAELLAAKKLHVPDVLPGGELLLIVPRAPVRPIQFRIQGPRAAQAPVSGAGHVSLAGLPAGVYRVVPFYEGGIGGEAQRITVTAAATTLAVMAPEAVGAVRVSAPDYVCGSATEMGIDGLVYADVGVNFRTPPNRRTITTSKEPRCVMTFGGLKPGTFEAYYRSGRMPLGTGEFVIAPQAVSPVDIAGRMVLVEGRATMNGKPVPDAAISFHLAGKDSSGGGAQGEARTDTTGNYRMALERAGEYRLVMRARDLHRMETKEAHLVEGRNFYDFAVTGGTITVDVTGWEKGPVQVVMRSRNASGEGTSMASSMFSAPRKEPIVYAGLRYGEYQVLVVAGGSAGRPSTRDMSKAKTVVISEASPEAKLTFDVSKQ